MYVSKEMKIVIILSVDNECVRFHVKCVQQCIPYYQNMSISTYESASIRVVQLWKNFLHDLAMSFLIIRTFKHLHIHVPLIQVYLNNFSIAACGLGLFRDA